MRIQETGVGGRNRVPETVALLVALCMVGLGAWTPRAHAQGTPRIIFDSDMSSDWDDVGDIAALHGLAALGECQILAMMVSSQNGGTALCMDAINTYYGKPDIPIGVRPDVLGVGGYPGLVASAFPHDLQSSANCPLAVDLYRQTLAAQPDKSVTIVTTGYLNNLEALLKSGPDQYSSLNGMDLVSQKVALYSCAGGCFPSGDEFNFRVEPAAAYYVVNNWPARVMFVGYDIGQAVYTGGRLPESPTTNPIRYVYVDIEDQYPYPSWGQIMVYLAVREAEGLWGAVTVGHNNANPEGSNWWSTESDPTGDQDQGYLLEIARTPARAGLDAVIMLPPNNGSPSKPGEPSNVRATVVGGNAIDLQWTDNAYNEDGFVIERNVNGVFTQVGTTGADVASYSDTGLASTANTTYRVKAYNTVGDSIYSYVWVYSGWTEINFAFPGDLPLYTYYQCSNLRWSRGGDFRPDHVTLNNDSTHTQDVTVNVDVGALGSEGAFYLYVFYQDQNNWYRLKADGASSKFEKRINGTTSQVGPAGPGVNIGNGSMLRAWQIEVTSAGTLKFISDGTTFLNVSETLGLSSGKIGLGGVARTPVWENFRFYTDGDAPPPPPTQDPEITSPVPGSTLASSSETFHWTHNGTSVSDYTLQVGTTVGGTDVHDSGSLGTATSCAVSGLPTDGSTVHVTLRWLDASWKSVAYTYDTPTVGDGVYLSDLDWASATCGYGSVHEDTSVGGSPITLEGVVYGKGLGTHAHSEVVYNIGGQYDTFICAIGVDDEEGANGSVAFQVYLDGVSAFDSGTMTGGSATQSISLSVVGVSELKLVVTDGGNGISNDHADWADARLLGDGGAPPAPVPTASISISDVALEVGTSETATITFAVTLSSPSAETVTVVWTTADGTATVSGGDYTSATGIVTFGPGETTAEVTVEVSGDGAADGDEAFTVELSGATNATIADAQATGTIADAQDGGTVVDGGDDSDGDGDGGAPPSGLTTETFSCTPGNGSAGGAVLLAAVLALEVARARRRAVATTDV